MPERQRVEMRHSERLQRQRRRQRTIVAASVIGVLAVLIAGGAIVFATFPRAHTARAPLPAGAEQSAAGVAGGAPVGASAAKPAGKKAAAAPSAAKLPLGMAGVLPGSRQLVVATGPTLRATTGTLRIYNLGSSGWKRMFSAACRFGSNGLVDGSTRKQGGRTTPTGIWWPGTFVWGWHPTAPSGTRMPYRQTTKNIWWSDESGSTYNSWVDSSQHIDGEHLVDARVQYEYAWSTGYNAKPNEVVEGRGTAIFLHVFDPPDYNKGLTAGCVAVSRNDMIRVLRTLDPDRKPCFAIGTEATGTPTSISAY